MLLLAWALAACGGGTSAADAPPPAAAAVPAGDWVVLGTSTAAGVGAPPGKGWVALLSEDMAGLGVKVKNAARAGTLTYHWLPAATVRPATRPATIDALDVHKVLPAAPSLVLLSFPSNDAMAGFDAGEVVDNLLRLRRIALDRGAVVYVTSSQPRDDADAAQRATMQDVDSALASQLLGCFVDVRSALAGADGGIAPALAAGDGVHLNAEGHRRLFEQVRAAIVSGRCAAPQR